MRKFQAKGYINAVMASVSYGTNPLFALPMYKLGMGVNSVLFYRYLFAVVIYGLWLKFHKKVSFRLSLQEFVCLFIIQFLQKMECMLLKHHLCGFWDCVHYTFCLSVYGCADFQTCFQRKICKTNFGCDGCCSVRNLCLKWWN